MQYKKLYSIHVRNDIWSECDFNVNMAKVYTHGGMWRETDFIMFEIDVNFLFPCRCDFLLF